MTLSRVTLGCLDAESSPKLELIVYVVKGHNANFNPKLTPMQILEVQGITDTDRLQPNLDWFDVLLSSFYEDRPFGSTSNRELSTRAYVFDKL